jgi:hypothetical protein
VCFINKWCEAAVGARVVVPLLLPRQNGNDWKRWLTDHQRRFDTSSKEELLSHLDDQMDRYPGLFAPRWTVANEKGWEQTKAELNDEPTKDLIRRMLAADIEPAKVVEVLGVSGTTMCNVMTEMAKANGW